MRSNTQFGKVVSSHSSACGASSFSQKLRIDSRSASCSSVKMKWRFLEPKSGFRIFSAVAMGRGSPRSTAGPRDGSRPGGESKQWYCLLSAWRGEARRGRVTAVDPRPDAAGAEQQPLTRVVRRGARQLAAMAAAARDRHAVLVVAAAAD